MKRRPAQHEAGLPALEMVEQCFSLLRQAPWTLWGCYYIGTLPFVAGLVFFWSEMSGSPFAREHLGSWSGGLALLYLWMGVWKAVYAARLQEWLQGDHSAWTWKRVGRLVRVQAPLRAVGLVLVPLSSLLVLPFPWSYAWFQTATAIGSSPASGLRPVASEAALRARMWGMQNVAALLVFTVIGLFVFLNLLLGTWMTADLLRRIGGVETRLAQNLGVLLNTSTLLLMASAAYLAVDPLVKAFYALRLFYARSLRTGADLRIGLRRIRSASAAAALGLLLLGPGEAQAAETASREPPGSVLAGEVLEERVKEVLQRREFRWRMPREAGSEAEASQSLVGRFLNDAARLLRNSLEEVGRWIGDALEWIARKLLRGGTPAVPGSGMDFSYGLKILLGCLGLALLGVGGYLLFRHLRRRTAQATLPAETVAAAEPDLADEQVLATQLPEDQWLRKAEELIARGELRLGLRALHLASLSVLSERQLVQIAPYKSNLDYCGELGIRCRATPDLPPVFRENAALFDRIWYGRHEATPDLVRHFRGNVDRLRTA